MGHVIRFGGRYASANDAFEVAVAECEVVNLRHPLGYSNDLEAGAFAERAFADMFQSLGNLEVRKFVAVDEFANRFISEIYLLNGRKVEMWIL